MVIIAILVCCSGISPGDQPFACPQKHDHCSQCIVQGCILCQFRRLNSWKNTNYRDLLPNDQHILYKCDIWVKKSEEAEKLMMNNSNSIHSNGIYSKENLSSSQEFGSGQLFFINIVKKKKKNLSFFFP